MTMRKVKSSMGGEVYALSKMVDHVLLLEDPYGPVNGMNPGVVRLEDCESLSTQLKTKKTVAERRPAHHFLSFQQALDEGDLEGAENWKKEENERCSSS